MQLPVMIVTFDDGTEYKVEAKARDLLTAERAGQPFNADAPMTSLYAIAHAGLARMQRTGQIAGTVKLPATFDELAEVADIATAEGKE